MTFGDKNRDDLFLVCSTFSSFPKCSFKLLVTMTRLKKLSPLSHYLSKAFLTKPDVVKHDKLRETIENKLNESCEILEEKTNCKIFLYGKFLSF